MSQALFAEQTPPLDESLRDQLVAAFLRFLPDESVLREDEDLYPYESDGLAVYRQKPCLLYTSPSPRDRTRSRMPSSA